MTRWFTHSDDSEFISSGESSLEIVDADTEQEAIFKACEWILKD